jgi:hypothetical protein
MYCKSLRNLPKLGFLVSKYGTWQPCLVEIFLYMPSYQNVVLQQTKSFILELLITLQSPFVDFYLCIERIGGLAFKNFLKSIDTSRGQCYDHYFLLCSPICFAQNWRFIRKPLIWSFLCQNSSNLCHNRQCLWIFFSENIFFKS